MASNKQKRQIIHAFEYKFKHTNILTRYPGTPGSNNGQIGFHDDSFTYNTINSEKDYFFYNQLKKALKTNIWKTQPIGGEFRPEGQDNFLNGKVTEDFQDYDECVNKTHCSWLMMRNILNVFFRNLNITYHKLDILLFLKFHLH